MKTYKRKPVTIEAEQWFRTHKIEGVRVVVTPVRRSDFWHGLIFEDTYHAVLPDGTIVMEGDYVLVGDTGGLSKMSPIQFSSLYEDVR